MMVTNSNTSLVLMQLEANNYDGEFGFELGPEIPIVGWEGNRPIGIVGCENWTSTESKGTGVLERCFFTSVVKDRAEERFFCPISDSPITRTQNLYESVSDLRYAADAAIFRLIQISLWKARGEKHQGTVTKSEIERLLHLQSNCNRDLDVAALYWACGCESELKELEDFDHNPHDVLQYLKDSDLTLPPRLFTAVGVQPIKGALK